MKTMHEAEQANPHHNPGEPNLEKQVRALNAELTTAKATIAKMRNALRNAKKDIEWWLKENPSHSCDSLAMIESALSTAPPASEESQ